MVLDGRVHTVHLRRYILSADISVVPGQGVALKAERTDPDLLANIDVTERVEDGSAGWLANDRLILQKRLVQFLERSEECAVGS